MAEFERKWTFHPKRSIAGYHDMKRRWRIRDLIDLEYFLHDDDDVDPTALVRRDRDIYLKDVVPVLEKDGVSPAADRKTIIRLWLKARRRMVKASSGKQTLLPGKLFVDLILLLLVGFLIAGVIIGLGLAFSLLQYRGTEPVNVSMYVGIFVFFQIILVLTLMVFSLLRRWISPLQRMSLLQPLFVMLLSGMFKKVATYAANKFSAEQRNRFAALGGFLKGRKRIYGPAFYWPVFVLAQVMGIGFNMGVLTGSILRIVSLDIAFGWQSTIQFSSQAVYLFVKMLAIPWSWLITSSMAHPTYVQIEGSRMVLKDGIYHLATPDLISWWPFLLLAVLCYGLLPRVILFTVGIVAQKRATDKVAFNHAACARLMRRLNTPLLETDGHGGTNMGPAEVLDEPVVEVPKVRGMAAARSHEAILIVPDEIPEPFTESLEVLLQKTMSMKLRQRIEISGDFEEDLPALSALTDAQRQKGLYPVVVIQEAWQPPIAETLFYFRKLRELLGLEAPIHIFLVGKPTPDNRFTDTLPADWHIWQQAIQRLGDPFIEINGVRKF